MTLAELLEEDREKLLRDLAAAEEPERCEDVLERELDRLLYRYNGQSRDEAARGMAAVLLAEAKMLLPLLTAGSSTRLWESTQLQDEKAGEKKTRGAGKYRTIARILLAAGCVAGLLLLLLFPARDAAGYGRTGAEAVLLLAGVLLFYLSGRLSAKAGAKGQEKLQRVEVIADPDAVYRTLRNMLYFADQSIQEARGDAGSAEQTPRISSTEEPGSAGEDRDLPREELDLLSGILEAGESGDGAYALEQADRVRYYLHTKGYETQQFEEGREAMFELMPGDRDVTISPAITKGEKLVKRGKAAHRS